MSVSVEVLRKVIDSLRISLKLHKNSKNDIEAQKAFRDACIQRFEYCIELAWKTSMKVLDSTTAAAKPAIREMARTDIIDNPEQWISFIEARNETSHSYDEDIAIKVFKKIEQFFPEVNRLIVKLEKIK